MKISKAGCASNHAHHQRGFSLIELMVVLAIIMILSLIAVPQYKKFSTKAKLAAALAELAGGKAGVEAWLAERGDFYGSDNRKLGVPESSERCETITAKYRADGGFEIDCLLRFDAGYNVGTWRRNLVLIMDTRSREWRCWTAIPYYDLLPKGCGPDNP
ncbi:prepilin-type cleavage/methylation domain-containing protein [Stenotrophomonas maltophilia]|nr:pilin [Stenotrophomonas maltophilia]MDQ4679669.1 prepilin-type N-terminal cleavage/methylation domain-containing protein [Stenotrophomonas maltophilia group sp. RNC7]PSD18664.1 prepilin-type cleavage/methylation domain-containing protein [Stenotrophomonas maltophilia]